jgi:CubicO group peptidase (beta-lactamase class C family)
MNFRTLLMVGTLLAGPALAQSGWPPPGWRLSPPEQQGIDSAKLAQGLQTIWDQKLPIHSLLILRNGAVVLDSYFYPYEGKTVHDLASVSKSLMTTLIGIAADQGKLRLDDTMVSFFPERTIANRDARKEKVTLRHLVSMSSGLACTQTDREETQQEMMASRDWVQFSLDRPMTAEPGRQFNYCNPSIHLLSPILQKATAMNALEFAQKYLFEPLGIKVAYWDTDAQGHNRGWGDAHLHPHDLAKLGYLWLNKGQWEGKQIVSKGWVEDSVRGYIKTGGSDDYGYGWWIPTNWPGAYNAAGRGGQRIIVIPDLKLVIVTTGGGFEFSQIEPLVVAALIDSTKPLPANPAGVEKLKAALKTIAQAPQAKVITALPDTAKTISGKTFVFEANPLQIKSLRLEFVTLSEARMQMTLADNQSLAGVIGLDGVYRMSPGRYNIPWGMRGSWTDLQTFVLDYDFVADLEAYLLTARFEGGRLKLDIQDRGGGSVQLVGQMQNP